MENINFLEESVIAFLGITVGIIVGLFSKFISSIGKRIYYKITTKRVIYSNENLEAIIFTTGFDYKLQRHIVNQVNPNFVGIVTTSENIQSTEQFKKELRRKNIDTIIEYADKLDVENIKNQFDTILDWLNKKNISKNKIAIDLTGGMVLFSLGAYLSGLENEIDIIYTSSEFENGKLIDGTQQSITILTTQEKL